MKRWITYIIVALLGLTAGFFAHKIFLAASSTTPVIEPESQNVSTDPLSEFLRIYTLDGNTDEEFILLYIPIDEKLTLRQRLEYLASMISKARYRGLPIEIMDIENRNGLDIVKVNLKEGGDTKGPSWNRNYFQGSCGGGITTHTLKESFLQRDYAGEWIDGVEFYYEGRPLKEFDHVLLDELFLRSPK